MRVGTGVPANDLVGGFVGRVCDPTRSSDVAGPYWIMKSILKRGDEVELEIGAAAFSARGESSAEGKAVARLAGFVIFVEGGVPGDVVRARIFKVKKNFAEARVVEVLKPSEFRTAPRCEHFGVCGGCKWQHVEYQLQLKFKQQHVVDAFERIGGFSSLNVLPILGAKDIYFYRNKMEFSFSDQEWIASGYEPPLADSPPSASHILHPPVFLGLHVPMRYDKVLDIQECHLQSDVSNRILHVTRDFAHEHQLPVYSTERNEGYFRFLVIRQSSALRNLPLSHPPSADAPQRDSKSGTVQRDKRKNELMVNLVTFDHRPEVMQSYTAKLLEAVPEITTVVNTINSRKAQIAFGEREEVYHGSGVIHERLGNLTFTISTGSFFQTNTDQAETLYSVAKSFAELRPTDVVFDLYSGTGSIALFVSDAVKQVVGIESVESAVKDANRNAQLNNVSNCKFVLGDLKDRLTIDAGWMDRHAKPDVVIIDPPRSGMHPKVVEEVAKLGAGRIVYVSCNPATQARDVKMMCEKGYELVKLQPVDMFPHTYHIENVALLVQKDAATSPSL